MKKYLSNNTLLKRSSNVKVGKNDVHSIKELKLWVRLWSPFRFTVVWYIWKAFLSILSTGEICSHNPVCFLPNWRIFLTKIAHHMLIFSPPCQMADGRWQIACHEFHHNIFLLWYTCIYFSNWKENVKPPEEASHWAGSRLILRRLYSWLPVT